MLMAMASMLDGVKLHSLQDMLSFTSIYRYSTYLSGISGSTAVLLTYRSPV